MTSMDDGERLHRWARDLFPICRSLTGPGVRQTLNYLRDLLPGLQIHAVPSGSRAFDWTVPQEWTIREAYVDDPNGRRIIDLRDNNLHVVGYSTPVDTWLELDALQEHLHSRADQPEDIPYVTSYYARNWGFCLPHSQRQALPHGRYHAVIDSTLQPGVLNYADLVIRGDEPEEVLLSTYICHPSMANNEVSGPVVVAALARWIASLSQRRLTYRFVFAPETIGSIVYLAKHLQELQRRVIAGYVVTCVGDDRAVSFVPSRLGDTLADRVARHVLKHKAADYIPYSYLDRGSDERQFCSPGVDLPIASITRSKYECYPEYHSSADNLSLISPSGLQGSLDLYRTCLETLEANQRYVLNTLCEPHLSRHGLYPTLSSGEQNERRSKVRKMMDCIAYCDGAHDIVAIADRVELPAWEVADLLQPVAEKGVISPCRVPSKPSPSERHSSVRGQQSLYCATR